MTHAKQPIAPRTQLGLTMVELMMVLVISAILLSLAVPSFVGAMRTNALARNTSNFLTAVNLARSEALTRNRSVTICKRDANGGNCDPAANWDAGWIVFVDLNGNGQVDAGPEEDIVVRIFDAIQNNHTFQPTALLEFMQFGGNGRVRADVGGFPPNGVNFRLCSPHAYPANDENRSRTISFSPMGRAMLTTRTIACP